MLGIIEGAQQQRFAKYIHKAAAVAQAGRVLLGNSVSFISSKPQSYFQKGDQIRFWDSYPTEQERDTAPWGRREKP